MSRAVARDIDNFRAALDWAAETESADAGLRLVAPLAVHGTATGHASMEWAGIAAALPGASEHPSFPEVGSWAAFAAGWAGDLETAATLADAVEVAEARRGTRSATASLNRATLAVFRGDLDESVRHGEVAVALARATDDPYELATSLTMLGVAEGYRAHSGYRDPTKGIPALEEAVQVAREAGIGFVLSTGLLTLAVMLPRDETSRTMALLDEAVELGTTIGAGDTVYSSCAYKALREAGAGNWRAALQLSATAAQHHRAFLSTVPLHPSLWAAAVAFVGLGHAEPAAVLVGAADATGPAGIRRPLEDWGIAMAESTDETLLDVLGDDQLAALRDRGAALRTSDVVAFLCSEADRVLGVGAGGSVSEQLDDAGRGERQPGDGEPER
jgi:hypothetical protein